MVIPLGWIIVVLLIAGLALWVLGQIPWIDASMKQVIRIVIIVVVVLWLISIFVPGAWTIRISR